MTINHLNLVVTNVANAAIFFETFFNFTKTAIKGDNAIAVLQNQEGFTLVLMTNRSGDVSYPANFHIGFMVDSAEKVDAIHQHLVNGGIAIDRTPGKVRNSYTFYFYFDNLFIEVGH